MNNEERDRLIVEMHQDIKWIKQWIPEHKTSHARYLYFLITTFIAAVFGLIWGR